jgi:hypothetical protein
MNTPKRPKKLRITITLRLAQPVFNEQVLEALHQAITRHLPQWSVGLKVAKHEDVRKPVLLNRHGDLCHAIEQAAPIRLGFGVGSAVLKGAYKGLTFYLDHSDPALPPASNGISVEIYCLARIEDRPASEWTKDFFEEAVSDLPVVYGRAHLVEEFEAKNHEEIVEIGCDGSTTKSVQSVGIFLQESLPGLYWLNYFGAPYVWLMGEDRLLSAPAYEAKKVGSGVLIALDVSPLDWQSGAAYKECEEQTLNHLGRKFFFLKGESGRCLTAPDFRVE